MDNIALLVISCDKYQDLWNKYFTLFKKYWPDCPFPIYLQTNFMDFDCEINVNIIKVGIDNSWSDGLMKSLSHLEKFDYVLLMMEDMFLNHKVDNSQIVSIIAEFNIVKGNFITLINEPLSDKPLNHQFGIISPKAMYRSTATAALWKREVLIDVLNPIETAWQFEKKGSIRTDKYNGFYSVHKSCFNFFHGVIKGKWTIEAATEFTKMGMEIDFSVREIYSSQNDLYQKIYKYCRKIILKLVPFSYRRLLLRK